MVRQATVQYVQYVCTEGTVTLRLTKNTLRIDCQALCVVNVSAGCEQEGLFVSYLLPFQCNVFYQTNPLTSGSHYTVY